MDQNMHAIGDIVDTTKEHGTIFGKTIPAGEPVKIVDITKDGYSIIDMWRTLIISCGWEL